jgi:hypothetical protein
MRNTTELEKEVLEYLNELRDSGATNMFGAGPYVEQMFNIARKEARTLVQLWMGNFNADGNYDTVKV